MGLSPVGPEEADESCRVSSDQQKCSSYWLANKCVVNYSRQGITWVQCPPKITNPPPTGGTGPLCNPSSIGKRFSFNFPSGKKWTLSKAEDARARAFYCGGGPVVEPPVVQNPTPMDAIYCTGGEGAWDGAPTYWMSSVRKGCKTNNQGESMPYGQPISRAEYDRGVMGAQPKMVCGGYLGWDGHSVFTEPNNRGEMIAWYIGGRCSPINEVRTGVPMR